jgi:transposase
MRTIPTSVTQEQFERHVLPFLHTAKRGFVSKIPLYKIFNYMLYRLHTGGQWDELPIAKDADNPAKAEISWWAVYYHFRKWSRDGSVARVWQHSIQVIKADLDRSALNLDGSHAIAKKGGEAVTYQGRKRAKTSNILPISDRQGYIVASTDIVAGHHNDAYALKPQLQTAFKAIQRLGISIAGAYFNADSSFDTLDARKVCFNHHVIPNIAENKRHRKYVKLGRKRLFNPSVYKQRFGSERTFAWIDKFRALLVRFDIKKIYFMGSHFLAFVLINLRHSFAN